MIELILFSIAFIGSLAAGLWDLKTTEIPDEIPTLMAVFGVFLWILSGNLQGLLFSLAFGTAFLVFGWLLYKAGQWGGGDAKLLSAVGFTLPIMNYASSNIINNFFAINFFFNVFFVGLFYMIVYSVALGSLNRGTFSMFGRNLVKEKITLVSVVVLTVISLITFFAFPIFAVPSLFLAFAALLILFWKYSKIVESNIFKRKIPVSKLRVGDVLVDSRRWDGLTEEEVSTIKKSGKRFVVIKEGVRFGMVFPIAVLVTYFFGNILFAFIAF
jgi:Flp pilus assembly protein protease CpaA